MTRRRATLKSTPPPLRWKSTRRTAVRSGSPLPARDCPLRNRDRALDVAEAGVVPDCWPLPGRSAAARREQQCHERQLNRRGKALGDIADDSPVGNERGAKVAPSDLPDINDELLP